MINIGASYLLYSIQRDNEISMHLGLGPEEVGRSLHVEPGLSKNGPRHDTAANIQLVPQAAVEIPNVTQIISKQAAV